MVNEFKLDRNLEIIWYVQNLIFCIVNKYFPQLQFQSFFGAHCKNVRFLIQPLEQEGRSKNLLYSDVLDSFYQSLFWSNESKSRTLQYSHVSKKISISFVCVNPAKKPVAHFY